jgi:hypothetical protein
MFITKLLVKVRDKKGYHGTYRTDYWQILCYLLTELFAYLLTELLTDFLIYLLTYLLTYWLSDLITYLLTYLYTYLPTPWSKVLLEKLTGSQVVKKFSKCFGTRRFITKFTSARHLSLSWASSIQSVCPHSTSWRSILILSFHVRLGLPSEFILLLLLLLLLLFAITFRRGT